MNHYNVLGVSPSASEQEVKNAYRKKARSTHPDQGGDVKEFQRVQEAYDTLKDKEKRFIYDNPRPHINAQQFSSTGNFADVFANMFGQQQRQRRQPQGQDIQLRMPMSLEEIAQGVKKTISVNIGNETEVIDLTIPKGVTAGSRIKFSGRGNHHTSPTFPRGDLYILVEQEPHPIFERQGNSIYSMQEISVWQAIKGCSKTVTTVNGKKLTYSIPAGTQSDTKVRLSEQGIGKGSHFVIVMVKVPMFGELSEELQQHIIKLDK